MLFKPDVDGYATQLKAHYSSIQQNLSFATIESYIEQSELTHILPLLGQAQYNGLLTNFNNNSLSAAQSKLLIYVRRALVYYIFADNLQYLDMFISDTGTREASVDETYALPMWKFNKMLRSLAASADNFAEQLLEFLEANQSDYPDWATEANPAYTFATELLINSGKALNLYLPLSSSRRVFLRLRPFLKRVEQNEVINTISQALLDAYKTAPEAERFQAINSWLIEAVAYLAFAKALPILNLVNTGEGYQLSSYNDGVIQNYVMDLDTKKALQATYEKDGLSNLAKIKTYLDTHIADYPEYAGSPQYVAPIDDVRVSAKVDNTYRRNFTF
jgi:hypothetical protein